MNIIDLLNKYNSSSVNTNDAYYKSIFGDPIFIPETIIDASSDFNCGAVANEIEFLRDQCLSLAQSFLLDTAQGTPLNLLLSALIEITRQDTAETDVAFRAKFRAIITEKSNTRRCTKWAIIDSLKHLLTAADFSYIEWFKSKSMYFQIRLTGKMFPAILTETAYVDQAFISQAFIGGVSYSSYLLVVIDNVLNRVKAGGVDYDILQIEHTNASLIITATIA